MGTASDYGAATDGRIYGARPRYWVALILASAIAVLAVAL